MTSKQISAQEPLEQLTRTKIIATIGPSTNNYLSILAMLREGVSGIRLNFSHSNNEERKKQIQWIRKASREYGKPVAIIQDLQGPKIRLGDFDGAINLHRGQEVTLEYNADYEADGHIPVQYDLSKRVKRGERLLIADGKIKTTITSVGKKYVRVRVENEGIITKRRGINLPDTDFEGDIITSKDRQDIVFGADHDMDYVALSFVQNAKDIVKLRRLLDAHNSQAKIIAKIETKAATENIDEIIEETDAVMIARGDLAVETAPEEVPVLQRAIIGKCLQQGKVSIVATQMLASMSKEPEPTRAEASDVATAVIVGADAVMLSDETASGEYPIDAVSVMHRIIRHTQERAPLKPLFYDTRQPTVENAIASAVITLAEQVEATAIVAETKTGRTARSLSAFSPNVPIIMVTTNTRVAQQLAIIHGGKPFVRPQSNNMSQNLISWLRSKKVFKKGDIVVTASDKYPGDIALIDTIKVRIFD